MARPGLFSRRTPVSTLLSCRVGKHGELGKECAPAYYEYANALIKQAENSTDVFGAALNEAEKGAGAATLPVSARPHTFPFVFHVVAKSGEEGEEGAADEVLEDLQIAWENLESARTIYETAGDRFELARVLIRLGDVSMLNENFPNAIADYEKCLAIREEICEAHDERLHQTHTALWEAHGLASSNSDQDHATPYLKHLKLALECMENCKAQLERDLKSVQAGMEDEQGRTAEQLITKIGGLTESIPEIRETIAAVQQEGEQSAQELKSHLANTNAEKAVEPSAEAPVVTTTGFGGFAMPTAGAKEVTTLKPRSKRKAPEAGESGGEAKVAKSDAKQDALAARMGGSGGASSGGFTFGGASGGGTTTIGF